MSIMLRCREGKVLFTLRFFAACHRKFDAFSFLSYRENTQMEKTESKGD